MTHESALVMDVCYVCGDKGFSDLLIICFRCKEVAEHVYCGQKDWAECDTEPDSDWLCGECASNLQSGNQQVQSSILHNEHRQSPTTRDPKWEREDSDCLPVNSEKITENDRVVSQKQVSLSTLEATDKSTIDVLPWYGHSSSSDDMPGVLQHEENPIKKSSLLDRMNASKSPPTDVSLDIPVTDSSLIQEKQIALSVLTPTRKLPSKLPGPLPQFHIDSKSTTYSGEQRRQSRMINSHNRLNTSRSLAKTTAPTIPREATKKVQGLSPLGINKDLELSKGIANVRGRDNEKLDSGNKPVHQHVENLNFMPRETDKKQVSVSMTEVSGADWFCGKDANNAAKLSNERKNEKFDCCDLEIERGDKRARNSKASVEKVVSVFSSEVTDKANGPLNEVVEKYVESSNESSKGVGKDLEKLELLSDQLHSNLENISYTSANVKVDSLNQLHRNEKTIVQTMPNWDVASLDSSASASRSKYHHRNFDVKETNSCQFVNQISTKCSGDGGGRKSVDAQSNNVIKLSNETRHITIDNSIPETGTSVGDQQFMLHKSDSMDILDNVIDKKSKYDGEAVLREASTSLDLNGEGKHGNHICSSMKDARATTKSSVLEQDIHLDVPASMPRTATSQLILNDSNCVNSIIPKSVSPHSRILWRGSFKVFGRNATPFNYHGLCAHPSNTACKKVFELTRLFRSCLSLERLHRREVWPPRFCECPPTEDDIGLYFFPAPYERFQNEYDKLMKAVVTHDLALRMYMGHAQLMIFSSVQLPNGFQKFQGRFYLWGAFRRKDRNQEATRTRGLPESSNRDGTDTSNNALDSGTSNEMEMGSGERLSHLDEEVKHVQENVDSEDQLSPSSRKRRDYSGSKLPSVQDTAKGEDGKEHSVRLKKHRLSHASASTCYNGGNRKYSRLAANSKFLDGLAQSSSELSLHISSWRNLETERDEKSLQTSDSLSEQHRDSNFAIKRTASSKTSENWFPDRTNRKRIFIDSEQRMVAKSQELQTENGEEANDQWSCSTLLSRVGPFLGSEVSNATSVSGENIPLEHDATISVNSEQDDDDVNNECLPLFPLEEEKLGVAKSVVTRGDIDLNLGLGLHRLKTPPSPRVQMLSL